MKTRTKSGYVFYEPPYTQEERDEFERRLRRGGDIKVIYTQKPNRPAAEPSPTAERRPDLRAADDGRRPQHRRSAEDADHAPKRGNEQ